MLFSTSSSIPDWAFYLPEWFSIGLAAVVRINKPQQTPENKTCSIDFTGREFVESAISGFFPEFIDGGGQFYGTIGIVECDG